MQLLITKLKSLLKLFRFLLPGLLLILIFVGFSYIGVFIEEDSLLMLQGGFNNVSVVGIFYLLSHVVSWLLCFYIFKYETLFKTKISRFLIPILSLVFLVFIQIVYYIVLFYFLTGLILWEINFQFSSTLGKQFSTLILVIFTISITIGLIANFIGIYLFKRKNNDTQSKRGSSSDDSSGKDNGSDNSDTETSSSFEDSITI